MGVSMNSLRVRNFLFFFSIRCGAITILWSVMLLFFYTIIVLLCFLININGAAAKLFFSIIIVLCMGEVMAVLTCIFFPAPNKTYSADSKTAKCLKYFAWYFVFIIVMLLVVFFCLSVDIMSDPTHSIKVYDFFCTVAGISKSIGSILNAFCALFFLVTAIVVYVMAVMYTFHLSILPGKHIDETLNDMSLLDKIVQLL